MKKRVIHTGEIIRDIRSGMSDTDLGQKYRVTPKGLQFILTRLSELGLVSDLELYERTSLSESDVSRAFSNSDTIYKCPVCGKRVPPSVDECPSCEAVTENFQEKISLQIDDVGELEEPVEISPTEQRGVKSDEVILPECCSDSEIFEVPELHMDFKNPSSEDFSPGRTDFTEKINDSRYPQTVSMKPCPFVGPAKCRKANELSKAAGKGQIGLVRRLLSNGYHVDSRSKYGNTPLMRACFKGHLDVARLLIESGSDLNAQNDHGNTALLVAVGTGQIDIVELLLQNSVNPDIKNIDGNAPLIVAAGDRKIEIARLLIRFKADPDIRNSDGDTAVMKACDVNAIEIIELLIANGADINIKNKFGNTALMKAAFRGYFRTVKLLLEKGADPNDRNIYGNTALMKASYSKNICIVKLLLDFGADAGAEDGNGNTALTRASNSGSSDIMDLLLQHTVSFHLNPQQAVRR